MSSGKVKCTCGWSWNKSDSSKKDMYICHECGRDNSNNMKNGGWLDNYNDSEVSLPEGYVGEGYDTSGRDYSPAWGGQFEDGGFIPIAQKGKKVFNKKESESTTVRKNRIPVSSKDVIKKLPGTNVHTNSKGEIVIKDEKGVYRPIENKQQPEIVQGGKPKSGTQIVIENKQKQAEAKKKILKPLDVATDVMQLGNFVPHPIGQGIGKVGNVAGGLIDGYQAYDALSEEDYVSAAMNVGSILPMFIKGGGYTRDMYNTNPGSLADNIASLGNRSGNYIPLTTLPHAVAPSTVKGINFNRALLGTLGAETVYDTELIPEYQMGGSIPGSVGFTYARTNSPAPSNGKYAKKTMASAQEGKTITVDEGDGKKRKILTDSKEYADLYNEDRIGVKNDDESISFNPLNEVVVTPYDKQYPFYQELSDEEKKYFNSDSPIGRQLRSKAQDNVGFNADKATDFAMGWLKDLPLAGLQAPQSALVEGVEAIRGNDYNFLDAITPGEQRLPSDVWGIENDYYGVNPLNPMLPPINYKTVGNTSMDIVTDPLLIEGLARQPLQRGMKQLGKIKTNVNPDFNFTDQLAIQKERLLNPKIKDKFFKYQRKLSEDNAVNKFAKSRADVNNRITPQNYDDFIERTQSGYLEELASIHNKQPYNLGVSNYSEIPVVFKDAPLDELQKSAIAAHEGNHSLFANTISKEMGEDILKPFGGIGSRPIRGYPDKHQVDEVFARMSQMKNAFGMKGNEKFTRAHLDKIRKSYSKEFVDNSIDDMLTKIPPGSKQEANFIKNMNKYAFGTAASLGAASQLEEESVPGMKQGGVIKDDMGQWNHPGEITEIGSNQITMQGVPYPVLGVSDEGDVQMMYPEEEYKFKGKKVTEFPMAKNGIRQEQKGLVNLDQLTNFTNYNTKQPGGWMDKYQ